MNFPYAALSAALVLTSVTAFAADYPAPKQGEWIARDFKFHTGQTMPELRLNYTTIGEPTGQPVLVLHGSGGSAASMLTPGFGGEFFGPGQPLDAAKYYIIIPDSVGHGAGRSLGGNPGPRPARDADAGDQPESRGRSPDAR